MSFDEMIAVLEKAFQLELKIVDDTTAFDGAARRFRLQKYEPQGDLAEDAEKKLVSFIETALFWSRAIADFRPADGAGEAELDNFHMISV